MNQDILNLALASLPRELLQDFIFQNICEAIPLNFKTCKKIEIRKHIYDIYRQIDFRISNYFSGSKTKDKILDIMFSYQDFLLFLSIEKKNDNYILKLKKTNGKHITLLTFLKTKEEIKVTTVTQTLSVGLIRDYQISIYYYDLNYKRIKKDVAHQEELKEFGKHFYLDPALAPYFYSNFKKYLVPLNKMRLLSEMELDDATRPIYEYYTFTEPMSRSEFLDMLCNCNDGKLDLEKLKAELHNNIEGETLVISNCFFELLLKYVSGYTAGVISTKGIILSKEKEDFTMHHITISNDLIRFNNELLTKEQALDVFHLSPKNEENASLQAFFNISKMR